jgi:general secretion pathway protein G
MHLTPPAPSTRSASQRGGSRRGWGGVVSFLLALVVGGVGMWASAGSFCGGQTAETTKLTMQHIDKALVMFVAEKGRPYPSNTEGLAAAARYFPDAAPPKDAWGNEFVYLSNRERYELISLGADGEPGGEDLDADIKSSELWRL